MKLTRTALLLITSCILLSSTCYKEPVSSCRELTINNNSDKPIYTLYSLDYPDTSLNFQSPRINPNAKRIEAHSKQKIDPKYGGCLGTNLRVPGVQKLSIFVFDAQLVESTPWSQVRQNYLVQKRWDLSQDDLDNNNYLFNLQ
jgi:hypothetical protein